MLLVLRLCTCLVLLHRFHSFPVEHATPSPLLQFRSVDGVGHHKAYLKGAGKRLNAFRGDDDYEGSRMAAEADDSMGGNYHDRMLRRKNAITRGPRPPIRPERHEKCDDDRDCRRSPSQICIKHARETNGRCQCPFYRPVEANVNGVVRCVTAKDLFDECRSNEECEASNPYLECINRLCSCQPPHVLKDHTECIGGDLVQEWVSWLVPLAVIAVAVVGTAAYVISKRNRSTSGSGNSDDDAEDTPAAEPGTANCRQQQGQQQQQPQHATQQGPESRYRGQGGEGVGTVHRGYQPSDMLSRLNVPPMKDWVRVPKGFRGNAQCTLDGSGGGGAADQNRVMWAQQAFSSLASPIYQSKLVRRLMAGKGASSSYPDSSSVAERLPSRSRVAKPAPLPAASVHYPSEVPPMPTPLQESLRRIAAVTGGRSSQRSLSHHRRAPIAPIATCSDEASSFRSFPVSRLRSERSRRHVADDEDDDDDRRSPLARLRSRSSSRYSAAAREPRTRSESSDALPAAPRKVFFADYKK